MSRVQIPFAIQDNTGASLTGASVSVYLRDTMTPATLYIDETSSSTQTNPVSTVSGRIPAWIDQGSYDMVITGPTFSGTRSFEAVRGDGVANIIVNSVGTAQLQNNAVTTAKIASGAVGSVQLAAGLDPTAGYTTYKLLTRQTLAIGAGGFSNTGTFVLGSVSNQLTNFGSNLGTAVGSDSAGSMGAFNFDPTLFAVSGRTLQLITKFSLLAPNPTAATYTLGLYPISAINGSGFLTLGTVVSGSTVTFTSPTAGSIQTSVTSAYSAPASGMYVLAAVLSSSISRFLCTGAIFYNTI